MVSKNVNFGPTNPGLLYRGPERVFRDTWICRIYLKGYGILLKKTEWNFRDIGKQRFLDFWDTWSKCYMILGILFQIFSGVPDIGASVLYESYDSEA